MSWRWFPWKFLLRQAARRQGFLDPVRVLSQLQNFAQPSEVIAPTELLRSGVVMHARGLINSLAIQHNLDWVWPYWIECQYNPQNKAFIPRAFSLTQINLTHRNWTALGIPGCEEFPIVDPRGLVTPFYDGWSLDAWVIPSLGKPLIPSRLPAVHQKLDIDDGMMRVITECVNENSKLRAIVEVVGSVKDPVCQLQIDAVASTSAWLVLSVRPYNPEGVSFVHDIALQDDRKSWLVNRKERVFFDTPLDQCEFSYYHRGDVFRHIPSKEDAQAIWCKVGMATAAGMYRLDKDIPRVINVHVPLQDRTQSKDTQRPKWVFPQSTWDESLRESSPLRVPDPHFQFLYEAALRTMVLHSPKEVYPGPFIYRRFWFRDAAFILNALLAAGFKGRVRRALDEFRSRQTAEGYFLSQEGEWDSNGEALWIMRQYCEMTGHVPPDAWRTSIIKAGRWICRKRLSSQLKFKHAGLMPSGFSAEHLGPNDFYYWDDFWSVAGFKAAAFLCEAYQDHARVACFEKEAGALSLAIDRSLEISAAFLQRTAMPASVYRRMDAGAVGSLVAGYPLRLMAPNDPRLMGTLDFLMKNCLIHGGFFHDMTHSGINPYLTLHMAQVLLRANDPRFFDLMTVVADLASSTGQWPEAIHPATGGGCMGDGQHVWAAAEWVLMLRNCFLREETGRLILCSGIPNSWLDKGEVMSFGPAPTLFGDVQVTVRPGPKDVTVTCSGQWFASEPFIEVKLPGCPGVQVPRGAGTVTLERKLHV